MSLFSELFRPEPGKERINGALDLHAVSEDTIKLKVRPAAFENTDVFRELTAAISAILRSPRDFDVILDLSDCTGITRDKVEPIVGPFVAPGKFPVVIVEGSTKNHILTMMKDNNLIALQRGDVQTEDAGSQKSASALELAQRVANLARGILTDEKEDRARAETQKYFAELWSLFHPKAIDFSEFFRPPVLEGRAILPVEMENPKRVMLCCGATRLHESDDALQKFESALDEFQVSPSVPVTLDLSKTQSIDEVALGILMKFRSRLLELGSTFALTGVCARVYQKLDMAGLIEARAFEIV